MSAMDKVNNILGKLPFVKLAEKIPSGITGKIPVLNTLVPFANHVAVILAVVVLAACFGGGGGGGGLGSASVAPAEDFEYGLTEDGSGVVIHKYIGQGGNIIVPDTIEGFPVTEISDYCFQNTAVTAVVLPDSLAPWWIKVSEEVYNFDNINVPPLCLFEDSSVQAVTFPAGITIIPGSTFNGCKELKTFSIPDTVYYIASRAYNGTGLTSVVIPEGVTGMGWAAFGYCKSLTSVTFPESIEGIGAAFEYCSNLVEVNLPSHPFYINSGAFSGCDKLPLATQKAIQDAALQD